MNSILGRWQVTAPKLLAGTAPVLSFQRENGRVCAVVEDGRATVSHLVVNGDQASWLLNVDGIAAWVDVVIGRDRMDGTARDAVHAPGELVGVRVAA